MKKYIYKIIGLPLVCGSFIYATAYVKDNEFHSYPDYTHSYETNESKFYNGEVLLPDYVHLDTLVVIDAAFLNEMIISDKYEVASDGDINDLLTVATVKVN